MQNRNHFSSVSRPRDPNYLPLYSWSHFLSVGYCVISDPERPHSESHYSANLAPDVMRDSNYTKKPQLFAPSHCQEMVRSRQNFWQNSQKLQQNCWVSPSHSWVGQGWRGWWWCMAIGGGGTTVEQRTNIGHSARHQFHSLIQTRPKIDWSQWGHTVLSIIFRYCDYFWIFILLSFIVVTFNPFPRSVNFMMAGWCLCNPLIKGGGACCSPAAARHDWHKIKHTPLN